MSAFALASRDFVREQLRAPLTLVLLVAIPVFFVLIFASVLGEFSKALGGTLQARSATAISAGWAAAFLSGTLAFFMVSSSRSTARASRDLRLRGDLHRDRSDRRRSRVRAARRLAAGTGCVLDRRVLRAADDQRSQRDRHLPADLSRRQPTDRRLGRAWLA